MPFGSREGRRRSTILRQQRATSSALKTNPTTAGIAAKNPAARRFTAQRVRKKIANRETRSRTFGGRSAGGGGRGGGGGTKGFVGGQLEGSFLGGGGIGPAGGSSRVPRTPSGPTGTRSTSTIDNFAKELERKFTHRRRGRR